MNKKFDDNTQFVYYHRTFCYRKATGEFVKNVFVILHVYSGANVSYLASDHLCIRAYSSKSCTWCKCNVFIEIFKENKKQQLGLQTNAIVFEPRDN